MKSLQRDAAFKFWDTYWDEARHEFFKVETVQDYGSEEAVWSPSYVAWVNGDKETSIELLKQGATEWSTQTHEKPILKRRIHIVQEPYTSYLEWEIMHYKLINIPLGDEKVYLLDLEEIKNVVIPGDFMIFDNKRVANSHYNQSGIMTSMDFYDRDEDISNFIKLKDLLLGKATELKVS